MNHDITVIGGGIVGSMLCRQLALSYPTKKIALLEKEKDLGMHTSTRNSAVLHAGFYYSTDSIKARICRDGCSLLTQYCEENKIPIRYTGKFLVPRNEYENQRIHDIKKQGDINGVELELMEVDKALKMEKYLKVHNKNFQYLYSPNTKVADQYALMKHLQQELSEFSNITVYRNSSYEKLVSKHSDGSSVHDVNVNNEKKQLNTGYIINSAGLYADKIAKQFDFGKNLVIWPIKGTYLMAKAEHLPPVKAIIYPVPPLKGNFFLGIHTTLNVHGDLKIGPSIFPALWRQQYSLSENFNLQEFIEIVGLNAYSLLSKDMSMYVKTFITEMRKKSKAYMINEAKSLTTQLDDIEQSKLLSIFNPGRAGIRSQLFDLSKREMVQDFIIQKDKHSCHLLNVASPGWTSSIPFAKLVHQEIKDFI